MNRSYQNTVARFNYYYNGNEKLKEALENLELNHKDDYTKVLEVFPWGDETQVKAQGGTMDEIIKKTSKIILDRPVSKWVDDSYLLLGKAYLFKADYFAAQDVFTYVENRYQKTPIVMDARVWSIFALDRAKMTREAEAALTNFRNENEAKIPKELKPFYSSVAADVFIKQKKYESAIQQLHVALKLTKGKKNRARYHFILAQLYQLTDKPDSVKYFLRKCVKSNPNFEMAFQAKLNLAKTYVRGDKNSMKQARKYLKSMLKEDKNSAYFDQIYYQLGNIEKEDDNTKDAIEYYKKSTETSQDNLNQKGISSLALAELYFELPDYKLAQAYYDSTIRFIQPSHPDYGAISKKQSVLTELITYKITFQKEDSLLYLSTLDQRELDKIVNRWIQEDKEKAEQKSQSDAGNAPIPGMPGDQPNFSAAAGGSGAGWYFYNPIAITAGKAEFTKRWGDRKYSDNWRYSQLVRNTGTTENPEEDKTDPDAKVKTNPGNKAGGDPDKQKYLADIPFDEADKVAAHNRIRNALIKMGNLYYEQLKYFPDAIDAYTKILVRYPGSEQEPEALYKLYKLYSDKKETASAAKYKEQLLSKYPGSDFALVANNAMTGRDQEKIAPAKLAFYNHLYSEYKGSKYQYLIDVRDSALRQFSNTYLLPKYELLYAMSTGAVKGLEEYKKELQAIIEQYPGTEEARAANNLLEAMKKQMAMADTAAPNKERAFQYTPDKEHYALIVVPNGRTDMNRLKMKLSDFNAANFKLVTYEITTQFLDKQYQVCIVKPFPNKKEATSYIEILGNTENLFAEFPSKEFQYLVITEENFAELFRQKLLDPYKNFYEKYYK